MPTRKKQEPDEARDVPSAPEEQVPAGEPEVSLTYEEQERLRRWLREKFH